MKDKQELRDRFLKKLYYLCNGYIHSKINYKEFIQELGNSGEEGTNTMLYLQDKGLAKFFTFGHITITTLGIDKVERDMAESYAERELKVLQKIYQLGENLCLS